MGLSASSLRIAMLTARKSSLEFEGQQINQQRLSLSNQTAALFNAMLTMQVPTPPDPTEFSKMVYTFNKGDGLSTLLNVSRNASGPYTHDVTYKGPKTDSVLMKKQLNNVGFKHENGQMSAVIDGLSYALSLNGNQEKLNEYLKTKGTYDNLKNIEAQMSSLQKMSSTKELSSQQMKQYFETLGLTSLETPQSEKVLDVQNTDDAFQNLYNAGNEYSYKEVTLTYTASTSPYTLDSSKRELLESTQGVLKMGSNNQHYTYTTNYSPISTGAPDLKSPISYNISQNDSGEWSWTLENVSGEVLNKFGIQYHKQVCTNQGDNLELTASDIQVGDVCYSNIQYNTANKQWSWKETREGQWFKQGDTYIDINGKENCRIQKVNYDIQTIDDITYFKEQTSLSIGESPVVENWMEIDGNIGYDIDKNGIISQNEFIAKNSSMITDDGVTYSIEDDKHLKVSSSTMFAAWSANTECLTGIWSGDENFYRRPEFNKEKGYWYNTQTNRVQIIQEKVNVDFYKKPEGDNWVWVSFNSQNQQWEYRLDLNKISKFEHNNLALEQDNDNNWYQDVDNNNDGNTDYQNVYTRDEHGNWTTKKRYTDAQLQGNIVTSKIDTKTGQKLPEGIVNESRKIGISYIYNEETLQWFGENAVVTLGRDYTIQQDTSGKFILTGTDLPSGVEKKGADKQDDTQYQGTINGVSYTVIHNGGNSYSITAKFKAWVTGEDNTAWSNDEEQDGYSYNKTNHTLTLTTPTGVIAQMLLRNQNNQRDEDCDKNITVNEMLGFYEQILKQFGLYGSSATYKTKLDKAKSDYLSTIDAKGVETPGENQALFNFIDANGKNAYIYVPLDYINKDGQVDSTYAYMYETSYLENQTETISQKANIIYDENGRIVKISFDDGTVVLPEVKTEQDEEAYNAAMVKYDYEKQVYDKELSDINTKTEIIAQQDKNLEIKLKSIDSQHSAISTEIEALNKVLQNNVKSSFGTFSA